MKPSRWIPFRSGLINLFKYDNETFLFEKGRILFRGNNGTGKSRVLALQLPFLLDGEISSHRVEPDGDPGRRFEWNLLLAKYPDRTGYTWIEFERKNDVGESEFLTLGCGLKAVEGRGVTDKWFFITSDRIGIDLKLISENGIVLARDRLTEALNGRGIHRSAKDYRMAVDQALFKLGERRYQALVDLLIQLRKPQLSREFNEQFLSSVLSEALTPLDEQIISIIAEAYRGLDDDRIALENLQKSKKAVSDFLSEYGGYCKIATRRKTTQLRKSQSSYEDLQRQNKKTDQELSEALHLDREYKEQKNELKRQFVELTERIRTLENSPEMKSVGELDRARQELEKAATRAEDSKKRLDVIQAKKNRIADDHLRSQRELEIQREHLEKQLFLTGTALESARLKRAETLNEAIIQRYLKEWIPGRKRTIAELENLANSLTAMERELTHLRSNEEEAAREENHALFKKRELEKEWVRCLEEWLDEAESWMRSTRHLDFSDVDQLLNQLTHWSESCERESPLELARHLKNQAAEALLIHQKMAAERRIEEHQECIRTLHEEQTRLETGAQTPPPLRAGISNSRDDSLARGSPFWKTVDFNPSLNPDQRTCIEAELEASGILDAWVTPAGVLFQNHETETFLSEAFSRSSPKRTLAQWLTPTQWDEKITAFLNQIGVEEGTSPYWIKDNGEWQMGPLKGKWIKDRAQYIGEGAREAERKRRIGAIQTEIHVLETEMEKVNADLEAITQHQKELEDEFKRMPSARNCVDSLGALRQASQNLTFWEGKKAEAAAKVLTQRQNLQSASDDYHAMINAFQLNDWTAPWALLGQKTHEAELALSQTHSLFAHLNGLRATAENIREQVREISEECLDFETLSQEAIKEQAMARGYFHELKQSLGSSAEEVLKRLADTRSEHSQTEGGIEALVPLETNNQKNIGVLQERLDQHQHQLSELSAFRDLSVEGLRRFASSGLFSTALETLPIPEPTNQTVSAWVDLARQAETRLSEIKASDDDWDRKSNRIHSYFEQLQTSLNGLSYRPEGYFDHECFVVRIPYQNKILGVIEIEKAFGEELENRSRIFAAREREVIENHLIGEVSNHIHDRLHLAEKWVALVNRELDDRPTSTGMRLRFAWEVAEDGPSNFAEIRKKLMRPAATWKEEDRTLVSAFLHQQLISQRNENPEKSWQEILYFAFDYRTWHRFSVERQQDHRWQRLTKRTFGTGSGGEKALMLTMPQFAAAAAHYRSADPIAPRLILLDEAFVGIDNKSRGDAMGLLSTFDLDLMMTSEREWGCYPSVDGISIYQLSVSPGIDAVLPTHWIWNGRSKTLGTQEGPSE